MPGLVPGIHVFVCRKREAVDGRAEPGHDGESNAFSVREQSHSSTHSYVLRTLSRMPADAFFFFFFA